MSSGVQNLVGASGVGLIAANYWLGGSRQTVSAGTASAGATQAQTTAAHKQIKVIGAELLFVVVATMIAGTSDAAAQLMLAVMVGLGLLYAIQHFAKGS